MAVRWLIDGVCVALVWLVSRDILHRTARMTGEPYGRNARRIVARALWLMVHGEV